jgi:hypothetical protein
MNSRGGGSTSVGAPAAANQRIVQPRINSRMAQAADPVAPPLHSEGAHLPVCSLPDGVRAGSWGLMLTCPSHGFCLIPGLTPTCCSQEPDSRAAASPIHASDGQLATSLAPTGVPMGDQQRPLGSWSKCSRELITDGYGARMSRRSSKLHQRCWE